MSEELSEQNKATVEKEFPHWTKTFGGGYWVMKPASLNRLLDIAREEGRRTPPAVRSVGELRRALNLIVQKVDDLTVTRGEIEKIAMSALSSSTVQGVGGGDE